MLKYFYITIISCFLVTVIRNPLYAADLNPDSIKAHIYYLGNDRLAGRATGSNGAALAADYIATKLALYGIKPLKQGGGFFQEIPMHGSRTLPASILTISRGDSTDSLRLGADYLMYKTGAETFMPRSFPLVFVGYGIVAPEYDYNDYQTVDVEDRIVVYLEGEPRSDNPLYFAGAQPTLHASPEAKQRLAISHGARGCILIPALHGESWARMAREFSFEDVRLAYSVSGNLSIVINPDILDKLFEDPSEIYRMDETGSMRSFALKASMQFEGRFAERDFLGRNVIGYLPGADRELRNSYLLLTAHYDHLGIGPAVNGDSIYNGVCDNASGVAVLLELARVFAGTSERARRSMIFLFLTGEEKGLLGSTYYTDNPLVPLYKTIADINIDGAPLFEKFKDVVAVGSEYSTLSRDLQHILDEMGVKLSEIPDVFFNEAESLVRSDQFSFAKAGIPSILIVEGLHYINTSYESGLKRMIYWNQNIYHSPADDLNQRLNFRAALQYAGIIRQFAEFLADENSEPQWNEGVPFSAARLRSIIEKK